LYNSLNCIHIFVLVDNVRLSGWHYFSHNIAQLFAGMLTRPGKCEAEAEKNRAAQARDVVQRVWLNTAPAALAPGTVLQRV